MFTTLLTIIILIIILAICETEIPHKTKKTTTISHSCFWYAWNGPGLTNVDHVEPTAPINIRNESLEGTSLMLNLEEEGTARSVCITLYLINLYCFLLLICL